MIKRLLLILIFGIITNISFAQSSDDAFYKDFESKIISEPLSQNAEKTSLAPTVTITISGEDTLRKVSKYIYGNNSNPYMTQMVTEPNLINYISLLSPNVIRFPGGNLTNVYFWNANPNQAPKDAPAYLFDSNGNKVAAGYWYGKNTASWTLSVDNYYKMLEMTNNTGIICVNFSYSRYSTSDDPVGAAAHLAADWVRYDDGRTKFWEIGNEDFGPWQAGYKIDTASNKDGQPEIITGTIYGKHFKVFADSMHKAAQEKGSEIYIGGQIVEDPAGNSWIPAARTWNSEFLKQVGNTSDFFIVHSYFTNYAENSTPQAILNSATSKPLAMMNVIKQAVKDNSVDLKPVALTEWNIFAEGSKQACSFINGMHAAIVLGELNKQGFSMAARWDLANGYSNGNDHGVFNNGDETGVPKWNPRPVYFYMYYFQKLFGDHLINSTVTGSKDILSYASKFDSGHMGIVTINKGTTEQVLNLIPADYGFGDEFYIYSLTGGTDNGQFSESVFVNENGPSNAKGGPIDGLEEIPAWAYSTTDEIKFVSPARSVQFILVEPGSNVVSVDAAAADKNNITDYKLGQNYPNPFNPTTKISFSIKEFGLVKLNVYNLLGQHISTIVNENLNVGTYERSFDASALPSGIYFYKLEAGNTILLNKMMLLK